jgi:selenophosphate synthase
VAPALEIGPGVAAEFVTLAHDPQTNGGLLAAVQPRDIEALEGALDAAGVTHWRVGRVEPDPSAQGSVALE